MADVPSHQNVDLQPGQKLGNYQVLRRIGQGGMGAVYEAQHIYIERRAAIKVLHAELSQNQQFRTRFLNEARAVNLIKHPGLVEIFEFGLTDDGTAYIVMEYLDGEPLNKRLKRAVHGIGSEALQICKQIATAITAAHEKGIVHRDLKPDNVMLVSDPEQPGQVRVKVLDFGIAKITGGSQDSTRTETGAVIGTPAYMAPEQCVGLSGVDGKADVYALGMILYELLTGTLPFDAQHGFDFMAAHVRETPRPIQELLPELPDAIATLVHLMIAKSTEERPSMDTVASRIDRLLNTTPMSWSGMPIDGATTTALQSGRQSGRQSASRGVLPSTPPGRSSRDVPQLRPSRELPLLRPSRELPLLRPSRELPTLPVGSRDSLALGQTLAELRSNPDAFASDRTIPAVSGSMAVISHDALLASPAVRTPGTTANASILSAAQPATGAPTGTPLTGWRLGVVVGVLLLCVLGLWSLTGSRRAMTPADTSRTQSAAAIRLVKWDVRSKPSGAEIIRADGQILGSTPWHVERPADPGETTVTLRLSGHKDKAILLSHNVDVSTEILLEGVPPAPAPASSSAAAESETKKTESSRKGTPSRKTKGGKNKSDSKDDAKSGDVKLLID